MNFTITMFNTWLSLTNQLILSLLRRIRNKQRKEYKCMLELLHLRCYNNSQMNRLRLKLSCKKINKNYKKYIKTINSMLFINKFNNLSVKRKELLINTLLFYKKRKSKPIEWPMLKKSNNNFFKSKERKMNKSPQLKTLSNLILLKKLMSLFNS